MGEHVCREIGGPQVYLTVTNVSGRFAYGADWGKENTKNRAGHPHGPQNEMIAYLTGIRDVLESAKNANLRHISIQTFRPDVAALIRSRQYPADQEDTHQFLIGIYHHKVKSTIKPPLDELKLFKAAKDLATEKCVSAEIAVFGLRFFDQSRKIFLGSFGVYCATSFANTKYPNIEASVQLEGVRHNYQVQLITVTQTLEMALNAKYKKITILTRSKIISDLIESANSGNEMNNPNCSGYTEEFEKLKILINEHFMSVRVKHYPGGNSEISLAGSCAWNALTDDLYMRNGVPVVYTDGKKQRKAKSEAVAAAAAYWGPDHPNNAQYRVLGHQTTKRGQWTAPVEVLKKAISEGYKKIIISTNSSLFEKSVNSYMKFWKTNGYKFVDGENVKNQDLLKEFESLAEGLEVIVEYVDKSSRHPGVKAADVMATEAVERFIRESEEQE